VFEAGLITHVPCAGTNHLPATRPFSPGVCPDATADDSAGAKLRYSGSELGLTLCYTHNVKPPLHNTAGATSAPTRRRHVGSHTSWSRLLAFDTPVDGLYLDFGTPVGFFLVARSMCAKGSCLAPPRARTRTRTRTHEGAADKA
jgi:hypothetical protein